MKFNLIFCLCNCKRRYLTIGMTDTSIKCINTFVAVDLETTGLPSLEYNKTKITEFAFVATSRENLLNTSIGIPRVTHKLTICVNPFKMIQPVATDITGLSNDILEKEKAFDEDACNLINGFLTRLTPPVCLVAHNGMKFDFPILKTEFAQLQMTLADDLLCTDSLIAFRQLFSEIPREMLPLYMQKRSNTSQRKVVDIVENETCGGMEVISEDRSFIQKINETTPKKTSAADLTSPNTPVLKIIKAQRKLFLEENECQQTLKSFKLEDIYKFITGKEAGDSHKAENDALLLMECMTGLGQLFLKWADGNAILFSDVKKLR